MTSFPLFVFMISLFVTTPVLAIPSLPSSFYGTVKVNNANVPDGTAIQALIGGQVYGQGVTQTYQGDSVYVLNVQGDNADTATQDGGREGDTIQFKIGGVLAEQTAVWHVGTNTNLNLTASSSGTISTPAPTSSSVPTQTALVVIKPSRTPTSVIQAGEKTPTEPAQPAIGATQTAQPVQIATSQVATKTGQPTQIPTLQVATKAGQPSPTFTSNMQPSPTLSAAKNETTNNTNYFTGGMALVLILVIAIIIGYLFRSFRKEVM
jgi:hypothetical protein